MNVKIIFGIMAVLLMAGGFSFALFIREIGRFADEIYPFDQYEDEENKEEKA